MGLKSPWELFYVGWGGVGLWLINIIEHGVQYYTLYEKSCILEIENYKSSNYKKI